MEFVYYRNTVAFRFEVCVLFCLIRCRKQWSAPEILLCFRNLRADSSHRRHVCPYTFGQYLEVQWYVRTSCHAHRCKERADPSVYLDHQKRAYWCLSCTQQVLGTLRRRKIPRPAKQSTGYFPASFVNTCYLFWMTKAKYLLFHESQK